MVRIAVCLDSSHPRLRSFLALAARLLGLILLALGLLALGLLALGLFASASNAANFSHHTRLYMGSGYSFGKHGNAFYNPVDMTSDTSRLFYESHRGLGQLGVSWSGSWQIHGNNGVYLSSSSSLMAGSGAGSFIDQDFCAGGVSIENSSWTCPQETTLWSESQHGTDNWFLQANATGALGFFLSRAKSRGRDFGLGLTLGYAYHNENDLAKGGSYNIDLPRGNASLSDSQNISQNLRVIGNKVFWYYPLLGVEMWSEQVPAGWLHPMTMKVSANYIPFAAFREEDSHFLRSNFAPVPNIISNGDGHGFQLHGSFSLPIHTGRRKAPYPEIVLALQWQKLFLRQGSVVFLIHDGTSEAYPVTRFTTENISAMLGVNLVW